MTTRQYARLLSDWLTIVGLDPQVYELIHHAEQSDIDLPADWQSAGCPAAARPQQIESTVRYLGIEVDDAIAIAEQVDI
jgi:hypothetical protein